MNGKSKKKNKKTSPKTRSQKKKQHQKDYEFIEEDPSSRESSRRASPTPLIDLHDTPPPSKELHDQSQQKIRELEALVRQLRAEQSSRKAADAEVTVTQPALFPSAQNTSTGIRRPKHNNKLPPTVTHGASFEDDDSECESVHNHASKGTMRKLNTGLTWNREIPHDQNNHLSVIVPPKTPCLRGGTRTSIPPMGQNSSYNPMPPSGPNNWHAST